MSTPTLGTLAAYRCSFCGRTQEQVELLLAGTGGAYICDECVDGAWAIVHEREGRHIHGDGQELTEERGPAAPEEER